LLVTDSPSELLMSILRMNTFFCRTCFWLSVVKLVLLGNTRTSSISLSPKCMLDVGIDGTRLWTHKLYYQYPPAFSKSPNLDVSCLRSTAGLPTSIILPSSMTTTRSKSMIILSLWLTAMTV
jgi:hypothetical protein